MARDRSAYRVLQVRRFGATLDTARQPVLGGKRADPQRELRHWRMTAFVLLVLVMAETLVIVIR